MSRIYEARQTVEATRSKAGTVDTDGSGITEMPWQREGPGSISDVPFTVYGRAPGGFPFYQEVNLVSGSTDGGLIVLRVPVYEGQYLLLINNLTSIEQLCRIVHIRAQDGEANEVGVAFLSPNPEFWPVPAPTI
jgi:hypothetical protein